ncbi:MAG: TetR/AcrR family transcriptional regulator [Pseudomonadales bacterium]|nr:TetR/AcrR family transcriptional regulator [Pseudomonadales bacterium]
MTNKNYHHGNLRSALVEQAIKLLEEKGLAGLSLRRVARAAGVSQAAPYNHFKNKRDLLSAVAAKGFERFGQRMQQEAQASVSNDSGANHYVAGLGKGYVMFALDNPSLYHLMFNGQMAGLIDVEQQQTASAHSYNLLVDALSKHPLKADEQPANLALDTAFAWSLVQGLSSLLLKGDFSAQQYGYDDVEPFIDALLSRYLRLDEVK